MPRNTLPDAAARRQARAALTRLDRLLAAADRAHSSEELHKAVRAARCELAPIRACLGVKRQAPERRHGWFQSTRTSRRKLILVVLVQVGPATNRQLASRFRLQLQAVAPCTRDLELAGLIERTKVGSLVTWSATAAGRRAIEPPPDELALEITQPTVG